MADDFVVLRLESDDFSAASLQIFELTGREAVSELFAFQIGVHITSSEGLEGQDLDPSGLGKPALEGALATLVFEIAGVEQRRVHGMIARIEDLLDTEPDTRSYRLLLVPRAHRLTLVNTQEIFMDL